MRLADVMERKVVRIGPKETIEEARALMARHHIRHLPVVDGREVVGVLSQLDVAPAAVAELAREDEFFAALPVERVMSPPITLRPEATVRDAANLMRGRKIDCIPVVDDEHMVGIVTASDILELVSRTGSPSRVRQITHSREGRH